MVRHDYKAVARSVDFLQFIGKKVNNNALCTIIIKDSAPPVTGKG
jgi:hypothetical protein